MAYVTEDSESGRWTKAVLKLIKLTRDGCIQWQNTGDARDRTAFRDPVETFVAEHEGQILSLWRYAFPASLATGSTGDGPEFVLAILDSTGATVWTFPTVPSLKDLHQAVQYKASGVEDYIDRLLRDP